MGCQIRSEARPPERPLPLSMRLGARGRCPNCGIGRMFSRYLKTRAACDHCGQELHHHRADDAPPYFTILLVGHTIVPLTLSVEFAYHPPLWLHMSLWPAATVILSLALLQPVKGALIGLQWALRMHGFEANAQEDEAEVPPAAV